MSPSINLIEGYLNEKTTRLSKRQKNIKQWKWKQCVIGTKTDNFAIEQKRKPRNTMHILYSWYLTYARGSFAGQWEKRRIKLKNGAQANCSAAGNRKQMRTGPWFKPFQEAGLDVLSWKKKSNTLRRYLGYYLPNPGIGKDSLNKRKSTNINKCDYIKLRKFCSWKDARER